MDILAMAGSEPLVLEACPDTPGAAPWSYAVVGTAGRLLHDGTTTQLWTAAGRQDLGADPFAAIERVAAALGATPDAAVPEQGPPFVGGLAGALAYDLVRTVEELPNGAIDDRGALWMDLRLATDVIAVDHRTETAMRIERPLPGLVPAAGRDAAPRERPGRPREAFATTLPRQAYREALSSVLDHIGAGRAYQVNLSQRLTVPWEHGPVPLYRRLRATSPAPHAALFVQEPGQAIVSVSPETFLDAVGRQVATRPMKGTRPRSTDPHLDVVARDTLVDSIKDRAEHVMIVDLERNDLGRVCHPGSVRVAELMLPEPHPTVWQLVSTVTGTLRPDTGWGALLRATFPSGSITGAPKIAAMRIIDQLEPTRRSWYCGAIGWLGPGAASMAVAIRTAVLTGSTLDYAAGGGIVADSELDDEIAESWAKSEAFLRATGATRGVPRE